MRNARWLLVLLVVLAPLVSLTGASGSDTGTWTPAASMVLPRCNHSAVLLPGGAVLMAAGFGAGPYDNGYNTTAEAYNPATDTWSAAGSIAYGRNGQTMTVLANGKVLLAGGMNFQYPVSTAQLYDPETNTWNTAASMTSARAWHDATLLQSGKVLITGGYGFDEPLYSAEIYDPVSDTWAPAAPMPSWAYGHSATLLQTGKVLVAGGYHREAKIYDPQADSWSMAGSMATERLWSTATLLQSGKVILVGGSGQAGAEIYDPVSNAWASAASMSSARCFHVATLLRDGKVLITGGVVESEPPIASDALVYDPKTDSWSSAGSMSTPRTGHTAVLLPDGNVLVAGGHPGDYAMASTEIYHPAEGSAYSFEGLLAPVTNLPAVNSVRAGQTIPLKWKIGDSTGKGISDPASFVTVTSYPVSCTDFTGDISAAVEDVPSGGSGLQYLGDGNWQYNWKTSPSYSQQCRVIEINLADGSRHQALFTFVK